LIQQFVLIWLFRSGGLVPKRNKLPYFNKEFASTISDAELRIKVLSFIDSIILQGFVAESVLEPRSINLISFKDNNYLQFKFTNINEYNSLKHDKFDIGKILFDEVIRKLMNTLVTLTYFMGTISQSFAIQGALPNSTLLQNQ